MRGGLKEKKRNKIDEGIENCGGEKREGEGAPFGCVERASMELAFLFIVAIKITYSK